MSRFLRRTRAMAHKELLHMARDPRVVYMALGLPVLMLLIFGYAVSFDVDHIALGVADDDRTRESRQLAEALSAGGAFDRAATLPSPADAEAFLRAGRVKAVLAIPAGYARDRLRGRPGGAQLLVDGSNGTVATIALGNAAAIVESRNLRALREPIAILTRFNPAMRSTWEIVPGVIALILSMVSSLLSALAVAREWERGSMEQLFATPVARAEIILGKLLPYGALGLVQALLVLTLGSYIFDVPIQGPLWLLFACSASFLLAMLGLGLFVSATSRNQVVSVQAAVIASMLPALLLSGFLFPVANMPFPLRWLSAAVPARYYVDGLRAVLLKGNDVWLLSGDVLGLTGFAAAVLLFAVKLFRRRLD
jgi:ABC-2 type transport system permease protein